MARHHADAFTNISMNCHNHTWGRRGKGRLRRKLREVTTFSGWQNQDSICPPILVPPVLAACGSSPGILPRLWFLLWPLTPPPCLSHSFIIYDRPLSSLTVECVSVLAPHVAWELVQGATISLGLTAPVPDSHGYLATVPCYWLVVTTDCYLSLSGYLRWAASWANPGTLFISENSICYAEVRVSPINVHVLILGE